MGQVVLYASVSVDGFIADVNDDPGPLFEWLTSGSVPLDEGGFLKVSQASHDHTRAYWDQIGVTVAGRRVFDQTDGWDGEPPSGTDHVVVVTHRPAPDGWTLRPRSTSSRASSPPWRGHRSWPVTGSSRSPQVTSVARCSPPDWSTRCAWTSCPSCSGPASGSSVQPTVSTSWRLPTSSSRANRVSTCGIRSGAGPGDCLTGPFPLGSRHGKEVAPQG